MAPVGKLKAVWRRHHPFAWCYLFGVIGLIVFYGWAVDGQPIAVRIWDFTMIAAQGYLVTVVFRRYRRPDAYVVACRVEGCEFSTSTTVEAQARARILLHLELAHGVVPG